MSGAPLLKLPSDECHWTLVMISQYRFRQWLGAVRQQAITWIDAGPDPCLHMTSSCHHVVKSPICIWRDFSPIHQSCSRNACINICPYLVTLCLEDMQRDIMNVSAPPSGQCVRAAAGTGDSVCSHGCLGNLAAGGRFPEWLEWRFACIWGASTVGCSCFLQVLLGRDDWPIHG